MYAPLADRIRPTMLEEVCGQAHLLGAGKPLRRILESGKIPNMIFFGPSGVGKTTVASILANSTQRTLHKLNGTTASTADIKAVLAETGTFSALNGTLLYLDEIQYFNKKQQQTLLEYIEDGSVTLIASTTENPYFYIYNAILSRCTVFEFKSLDAQDILPALFRAAEVLSQESAKPVRFEAGAAEHIAAGCGGDVRKSLNTLELCVLSAPQSGEEIVVSLENAKALTQRSSLRYDRSGDEHYDILSAFQKSVRGSDENAALHYAARLMEAGDLLSLCRRLLVIAAEDIGLAYPQAMSIVKACTDTAMQLGLPEARIPLSEAIILLCTAPKSNSAICAIDAALADVRAGKAGEIPANLRDGHYGGAQKLGRAQGYQYPHSFLNHYVKQQYLPDELKDAAYYTFGENKTEQAAMAYRQKIQNESN